MGQVYQNREANKMKEVKAVSNEKGFIKFVFFMIVLAFIVYAGLKFGMPYYRYSAFKSEVKEIARISIGNVEKTRAQIFERAMELKLPLTEEGIQVTKTEKTVIVRTAWSETVDMLGVYQKKLNFRVEVEE
jgi:hypothetical protein